MCGGVVWVLVGVGGEKGDRGSASPGLAKFGCLVCATSFFSDGDGTVAWPWGCVCLCE